jgi:hypothetical protein
VKAGTGEMRNADTILDGKSELKRSLRRLRHRWKDNIGMDLRGIGGNVWTGFIWFRMGTSGGLL